MKGISKYYPNSFTYPAVLFYGLFFVFPSLTGFYFAFTNWGADNLADWGAIRYIGLDNFTYLFRDPDFNAALYNTILFAAVTSFFKIFLGLLLALGLNQPLYTRNFLRTVFYIPAVI